MGMVVVGVATLLGVGIVAQVSDAGTDPVAVLVNYGAIGVMLALFVFGKLHSDREVTDLKKALAERDDLIRAFSTQVLGNTLPALTQSTRVLEAIPASETALLNELHRVRSQAEALVARLEAAQKGSEGEG